jgi:hypothetical protein
MAQKHQLSAIVLICYCCDGVRLYLWNWAFNQSFVCPPDDI